MSKKQKSGSVHTGIEIKCPDIIQEQPINLTSKDKERRTNNGNCMTIPANRGLTMDCDPSPITGDWDMNVKIQ